MLVFAQRVGGIEHELHTTTVHRRINRCRIVAASADALTAAARWLLYVRAHYLRMPLHLLLPHLLRKSFHRPDYSRENEAQRSLQARIEELLRLTPSRAVTHPQGHEP